MIRPRDRSRRGPHMSATPDSVFTNPEQRIADLERQLAGCKAELAEALQRENATAEVLGVINSSPGDLAPVFNAMLKMALTLCGATFGDLLTYSNELFHVSAEVHSENETAKRKNPFPALPGGLLDAIVRGEHVVFAEDILEHGDYRRNPKFRELVDNGGYRSVLAVALRKEGALVGALAVFRKEVGPFTDKQIALLQNFAAQAVIAMENARLLTETREALAQQTATAEVLQVINSSPRDLVPVFDAMLDKAIRLCGAVHGTLTAYDGEYFRCVASHNLPEALFQILSPPRRAAPNSPQQRLLDGERIVHIADVTAMPISTEN